MKADEARRMAINSVESQINVIKDMIKKAAQTGNVSTVVIDLKPATKAWLIENGYTVNHFEVANYGVDSISW